jgi:hypothetical protein
VCRFDGERLRWAHTPNSHRRGWRPCNGHTRCRSGDPPSPLGPSLSARSSMSPTSRRIPKRPPPVTSCGRSGSAASSPCRCCARGRHRLHHRLARREPVHAEADRPTADVRRSGRHRGRERPTRPGAPHPDRPAHALGPGADGAWRGEPGGERHARR